MIAVALAAAALALPQNGVVVPGKTFGGLQLGATPAQVKTAWGTRYGRCRDCPQPTWYFTYRPFQPQGLGVSFLNGHATAFFTVWSPPGWHMNAGLAIGAPETQATAGYGQLPRTECGTYSALVVRRGRVDTQIYLYKGEVWGFGLSRAGAPPCH